MSFKIVIKTLMVTAFLLTLAIAGFAQVTVKGKVFKRGVDKPLVPVEGVNIKCFRTDVEALCGEAVSNSNGEFSFSGLPNEAKVGFGISGKGWTAAYYPEFGVTEERAQKIYIEVTAGDGAVAPDSQLRANIIGEGLSAEEKADRDKREIELIEKIENIVNVKAKNEFLEKMIKEGNDAFNSGDVDTAIDRYTRGYEADKKFIGSAPMFLNNLAKAKKRKSINYYNTTAKSGDKPKTNEARAALSKALMESVQGSVASFEMVKADNSLDSRHAASKKQNLKDSKEIIVDSFRILGQLKVTFPADDEEMGKNGITLHMKALEIIPDDPGVLGSLMLSLYNMGFWGDDSYFQKSLNYGEYYLKTAPKAHNRREAVSQIVEILKTENKLTPQPIK